MVITLVRTGGDDAYEVLINTGPCMINAPERRHNKCSDSDGGGGGDTFASPPFRAP